MAKQSLLPSAGILLAAVLCGFVAALLVNIYISHEIAKYSKGSLRVLQLREDVAAGDVIREKHLKEAEVPAAFKDAFKTALAPDKHKYMIVNRLKAPRRMYRDQILYAADFSLEDASLADVITVRKGYELVVIPVEKDATLGQQLQPGSYVTVYADFPLDTDKKVKKTLEVIRSVQVRTIDGSTQPLAKDRRAAYETVGLELKPSQVRQLLQIRNAMLSKRFTLTLPNQPDQAYGAEPEVSPEALRFVEKAGLGGGPLPPE
jgi:Flp pilus assembly protein CpaB